MDLAQTLVGARESLTRYAMSLCRRRADAEDLVQTAFLRALERAARLEDLNESQVRGYLFRTVRNAWIDLVRKRAPESLGDAPADEGRWDDLSTPEAEALLRALPDGIRQAARLRAQGMSGADIAQALGVPAATVRTRLRAAQALAQKQIKLLAGKRVFVRAGNLEALGGVFEGDLSLLTVVPEGYALRKDDLKLDTHNAPSVSGRVFLTGELFAQPGALKRSRLEKLRMSRTAYVPLSEMDDWLGVLEGDAEWMPYEGRLTLNESQMRLTSLTQPQAIVNDGMLTLDAAPDALENVTLLVNNGQLIADDAQVSALGERLIQRGGLSPREPAPGKPEETFEGCTVVSDLANYIL